MPECEMCALACITTTAKYSMMVLGVNNIRLCGEHYVYVRNFETQIHTIAANRLKKVDTTNVS